MERLKEGEVAILDNGKEYIVFSQVVVDNIDYVYLMSNFKPLEIKFAKQTNDGDNLALELVTDIEEKQKLLNLFRNQQL